MFGGNYRMAKKMLLAGILALLPGVGLWQANVRAQSAPVSQSQRIQIKSRTFHLPIRIDRASMPKIREVCLYMKEGHGEWIRRDSVSPMVESFRCTVPRDGEYSFAVVTVDQQGNSYPSDLNASSPAITVVVETQPREVPRETIMTNTEPQSVSLPNPPSAPTYVEVTETTMPIHSNTAPAPVIVNGNSATYSAGSGTRVSGPAPQLVHPNQTSGPYQGGQPIMQTSAPTHTPVSYSPGAPQSRQIINTTRVGIDYNVGRVGPSGLGKIEVWGTQDQGRTWLRFGDDTDQRSPAEVDLPGEGVFGLRLVASNGNGFGGKAPVAGDSPATTIEVDLTNPIVNSMEVDPFTKNGVLDIRYRVSDKNLAAEPINLFYSSQRSGPWTPVAFRLKNEGVHRWTLPRDVPGQIFFRIEAFDLAGNVGRLDMQNPVMLDMTEPDINVTGVTPVAPRVSGPAGN